MERWTFGSFVRSGLAALSLTIAAVALGCAGQTTEETTPTPGEGGGGEGGVSGEGGAGGGGGEGGDLGPCGYDCSKISTGQCLKAVCNEGQYPGEAGNCVVINDDGAACDDAQFCTTNDTCDAGQCVGGPQNECDMEAPQCQRVTCDEGTETCGLEPAVEGLACSSEDLCQINTACSNGLCVGSPKDCFFSPLNECNSVACSPATGLCEPTPDPAKDNLGCSLTGDPCQVNKTCAAGQCANGSPKNCSAMTAGCVNGVCEAATGICIAEPIGPGGMCLEATDGCNVGICDAAGTCLPVPVADGTACNDYNSCTGGDLCTAGACAGAPVAGCDFYFEDNFENGCPPGGWTLGGDWECGTPSGVGPSAPYSGQYCIGTQIDSTYNNSQSWDVAVATTPPISLVSATEPVLSMRAWVDTEGSSYDGYNLKVSTDGGATFTLLTSVTPPYNLAAVGGEPAWGGHQSAAGWQLVTANLSAYVGQTVVLRVAFRTDSSVIYPGIYLDDLVVVDADAVPLSITTTSLPNVLVATPYSVPLQKTGGSNGSVWSIVGGMNHAWLSIDPATGTLSGTPAAADLGPFSVTVRVEEPTLPSNFYEQVLSAAVLQEVFTLTFEGACPDGWTLTGDWECGTPSGPGPGAAFGGLQCIGTQIDGNYNNGQTYAGATATSPAIDLTGTTGPQLSFRMWVHTEGSTYDAANLKISTDGTTFTQVMNVVPAYNLTVASEQGWGGNQSALGWQLVTADLTAYAGQTIYLRYAFRTDGSGVYPGVYIDQIGIAD